MKLIKSPWLLASLLIIVMYWWMDRTSNKVCEIRMESQKEIYENYIDSCLSIYDSIYNVNVIGRPIESDEYKMWITGDGDTIWE